MGPTEAYQSGGWPMVMIVILLLGMGYLARENREFRRRIDELVDAERTMLTKYQERDAEELKEHRRLREMEIRR